VASGWNKEWCTPEIQLIVTLNTNASILIEILYVLHMYDYSSTDV
jgi:hypothetical protein